MDVLIARIAGNLLLPPGNVLVLLLLALWWRERRRRLATAMLATATGLLLTVSMPLVADLLCRQVERYGPLPIHRLAEIKVDAIVILAGGWRRAPEYGDPSINTYSMQRLLYGVWLRRGTGLPIALSGGRVSGDEQFAEAEMMAQVLQDDFGLQPRWVEVQSRNTAENARYTVAMLKQAGVERILLVTHAFHMSRAVPAFEAEGITVIPAPMGFLASRDFRFRVDLLLPNAKAMSRSYLALHELLGRAWYQLRYGS